MFLRNFAEQGIDRRDRIDFIAPKLDPISLVLIAWIDFDHIAADAKAAPLEIDIVAFVL